MADIDLAQTGKDTTVTVLRNGQPVRVFEKVRVEVEPRYDVTRTKPLGTTEEQIDPTIIGWRLQLEIEVSTKAADEMLDAEHAGQVLRIPSIMELLVRDKYRDGTSKAYNYIDCKITGAPKTQARGEKSKLRLTFETGKNRLPV